MAGPGSDGPPLLRQAARRLSLVQAPDRVMIRPWTVGAFLQARGP